MEQVASKGIIMLYVAWLGEGCLLAGRAADSITLARRALDLAREHKGHGREAHALWLCGEIASRRDPRDEEQADASYHPAMTLAEELGMHPLVAHCHLGLGKLHRHTGQRDQSHEHLTAATTMYREMDMRFWLEQAEAELRAQAA